MDIGAALVADSEAAELSEPGQGALDLPTVPPGLLAAIGAAPGDARDDAAGTALAAAAAMAIPFVRVQLNRVARISVVYRPRPKNGVVLPALERMHAPRCADA